MLDALNLAGRCARCVCGKTTPSDPSLIFFEYRGTGSRVGTETCRHCGYYEVAHKPGGNSAVKGYRNEHICHGFESRGAFEFDSFYCGCGGWD